MSTTDAAPGADSLRVTLQQLAEQTAALVATAQRLDETALRGPSLCQGWTRAHVLAHLRGNADAMLRMVQNASDGGSRPMYDSRESRAADIVSRAAATGPELVEALKTSADALATAFAGLDAAALARTLNLGHATLTGAELPAHRLREVVFHHVDLDSGYRFADAPTDRVAGWLADAVVRLRANPAAPSLTLVTNERDRFSIGDGQPVVSASRAGALLWISRGIPDDIDAPPASALPAIPSLEGTQP